MKKVLIVEDEKILREQLDEAFREKFGFKNVTLATDGLEGFVEAYLQKFDLICVDNLMPFYKGGELVNAIRKKPGINQYTPVILFSAVVPELSELLQNQEGTYLLEKPLDHSRLGRYVKIALMKKKAKDLEL